MRRILRAIWLVFTYTPEPPSCPRCGAQTLIEHPSADYYPYLGTSPGWDECVTCGWNNLDE